MVTLLLIILALLYKEGEWDDKNEELKYLVASF